MIDATRVGYTVTEPGAVATGSNTQDALERHNPSVGSIQSEFYFVRPTQLDAGYPVAAAPGSVPLTLFEVATGQTLSMCWRATRPSVDSIQREF